MASGDIDVIPADPLAPMAVWRLADVDARWGHRRADALSPRLAALLVGVYSRLGDTVVSVGDDPALAGAGGAGGRVYRSVARPDQLINLDHVAGTVSLIVLPWLPADELSGRFRQDLALTFGACRRLMRPDGCAVVALAGLPPWQTVMQRSKALMAAAHHASLACRQHIVAITAPRVEHHFTWQARPADRGTLRAAAHLKVHVDLLVFVVRGGRRG